MIWLSCIIVHSLRPMACCSVKWDWFSSGGHVEASNPPTSDERLLAAFAHASIVLSFFGPIGPAIIWSIQRRKSRFASFQALQALGYQILVFWCWILGSVLIVLFLTLLLMVLMFLGGENFSNSEFLPLVYQFIIFLAFFGLWGVFTLIGIIGGVSCAFGRDFRYPILGNWLWKYLTPDQNSNNQIVEDKEDSWVAGMSHASAILFLWGMLLPLIVWVTQKDRSARLRFQSLQALVYQLIATLAYFVGLALYFLMIFGMIFAAVAGGIPSSGNSGAMNNGAILIFLIFIFVFMLFWIVLLLLVPIYHLFAFIAAIRVIRGQDYRYPLLGKFLAQRLTA